MQEFSKEEFEEWLRNPVTEALIKRLKRDAETMMFGLAESAGVDPLHDRYTCGKIHTCIEIANITFEEANEND
jgi:hypothetical protein